MRSFDSLFNQFCKAHLSFVGDDPEVSGPPPPSKIPIIAKTIVEMVLLQCPAHGTKYDFVPPEIHLHQGPFQRSA